MSRIGKKLIEIPQGVEVKVDKQTVTVKGKKGTLSRTIVPEIKVAVDGNFIHCTQATTAEGTKALWGLSRVLISNMVEGVVNGYSRDLEVVGVGYKAELKGKDLVLAVGLSYPANVKAIDGITFSLESPTKIKVSGCDKELVGRVAAQIRSLRPPEPYKGKGVRYTTETVRRKAGKTAGK